MNDGKGRRTVDTLKLVSKTKNEVNYENETYRVWYIPKLHQLTISRKDGTKVEPWYDIWNIKNQILGKYTTAIEVYSSEKDLIDGENQRHLFILDTNEKLSFENVYEVINKKLERIEQQ